MESYWHPEHFPLKVYVDSRDPIEFQEGIEEAAAIWNLSLGLQVFETERVDFGNVSPTNSCGWVSSRVEHDLPTAGYWRGKYYPSTSELCYGLLTISPNVKPRNISKVFIHELGHSLGLAHDEVDKRSIMYPTVYTDYPQYIMPDDGHAVIDMMAGEFTPLPADLRAKLNDIIQAL